MIPLGPVRRYAPPLVLGTVTIAFVLIATGFEGASRSVPLLAGAVTLLLLALDLISRTDLPLGQALRRTLNPDCAETTGEVEREPVAREIVAILWICGFTLLVMLVGFHVAIPIYLTATMLVQGGLPLARAALITLAFSAGIYVLFELALDFRLYGGALFS